MLDLVGWPEEEIEALKLDCSKYFDDNYQIGNRVDNKFNVWQRQVSFTKKDGLTVFWQIIDVVDSSEAAENRLNRLR